MSAEDSGRGCAWYHYHIYCWSEQFDVLGTPDPDGDIFTEDTQQAVIVHGPKCAICHKQVGPDDKAVLNAWNRGPNSDEYKGAAETVRIGGFAQVAHYTLDHIECVEKTPVAKLAPVPLYALVARFPFKREERGLMFPWKGSKPAV